MFGSVHSTAQHSIARHLRALQQTNLRLPRDAGLSSLYYVHPYQLYFRQRESTPNTISNHEHPPPPTPPFFPMAVRKRKGQKPGRQAGRQAVGTAVERWTAASVRPDDGQFRAWAAPGSHRLAAWARLSARLAGRASERASERARATAPSLNPARGGEGGGCIARLQSIFSLSQRPALHCATASGSGEFSQC